jgi:unsaturated rhamnogalacturonyl hydrolase
MNRRKLLSRLGAVVAARSLPARMKSDSRLRGWPAGSAPTEIGTRVAKRFLATGHTNFGRPTPPGSITYPETCTWYGALTFAQLSHNEALTKDLIARFEPLFGPEGGLIPTKDHVDPSVFGAVPLELYIETRDERYLSIGKEIADRQWAPPTVQRLESLPPDERRMVEDAVSAGLSQQTRFWIDDMYMVTLLQAQAFRATADPIYIDRAGREMAVYLDKLQRPNGLFYHAPDAPFFWGRGNGWMAAGMAELLRSLPAHHVNRPRVMAGYRRMMSTLVECQDRNGMWHQLIDEPGAWPETSCTGMFVFALLTGIENGWLDDAQFASAARRGWLGLTPYLNKNAEIGEVCEGTNEKNDHQYYLDRQRKVGDLHGQAPLLWSASAFLRMG